MIASPDCIYSLKWSKKLVFARMLGGKCACGNDDIRVLQFHHNGGKEVLISQVKAYRTTDLEKELGKCSLMCSNCHAEHHQEKKQNERTKGVKAALLEYKGTDCCQRCRYKGRNNASLDFHHRDRSTKLFSVANRIQGAFDVLIVEVDKCDVICKNCHALEHIDLERFNRLLPIIEAKALKKKINAKLDWHKIYLLAQFGLSHKKIALEFGCHVRSIDYALANYSPP